MRLVEVTGINLKQAAVLVADFRVALRGYNGIDATPDYAAGLRELEEYRAAGFPVYAAAESGALIGYMVCRVEAPAVWLESLFVHPEHRRVGVASALLKKAEEIAASYGEATLYHNVHPNNEGMIAFLRGHGYTVLNLIEIRKPYPGENPAQTILVGANAFDY